jgi:hypothetical protein
MIGKIASFFDEDEAADASPFGKCESGTRIGLCRRIALFFCDLPIPVDINDGLLVEDSVDKNQAGEIESIKVGV